MDNKNCFLFDMDGVLYDSLPAHVHAWCGVFKLHGIDLPAEEVYLNEGRPGRDTIKLLFKRFKGVDLNTVACDEIYFEKVALMDSGPEVKPMPYIKELISHLLAKGKNVGVVTGSKQPSLVDRIGKDFGIAAARIVTARDLERGKPAPDPYLMGLKRCDAHARESIVVENAPLGVRSAVAAGIDTLALNTGPLTDEILLAEGAGRLLSKPQELYEFLLAHLVK